MKEDKMINFAEYIITGRKNKHKNKLLRKINTVMLFIFTILLSGCSKQITDKTENTKEADKDNKIKLMVASDIHYFSPDLIEQGQKFDKMLQYGDGKQVNYIDQITDAFLEEVIEQQPSALILSGDITFNGEKKSHEDMAKKLKKVEDAGVPVLVIPGNHDINNFYARRYTKDSLETTEHISDKEFSDIYQQFGYDNVVSRDEHSLSYITAITDKLWIIMVDSCKYEGNSESNPSQTNGSISSETYTWLEKQLQEAENEGVTPIAVMHHNLLTHNPMFTYGYTLDNSQEIVDLFSRYHVALTLSGHLHIQNIASTENQGNTVYDIATSALSVYTNQYGVLEVLPGASIEYYTRPVKMEEWAKKKGITDKNLLNFEAYSYDFFSSNGYRKAIGKLEDSGLPEKEVEQMAQVLAEVNPNYFSGTANSIKQSIFESEGYQLWVKNGESSMSRYLDSIFSDPVEDENAITISLK
jgi:UDP-2,3-diacylglucosamine pyrophosphatase LpxH